MKCFERVLIFDGHLACVAGVEGEGRGKNERGKSPPLFSSFLPFPLPPRLACYAIKSRLKPAPKWLQNIGVRAGVAQIFTKQSKTNGGHTMR